MELICNFPHTMLAKAGLLLHRLQLNAAQRREDLGQAGLGLSQIEKESGFGRSREPSQHYSCTYADNDGEQPNRDTDRFMLCYWLVDHFICFVPWLLGAYWQQKYKYSADNPRLSHSHTYIPGTDLTLFSKFNPSLVMWFSPASLSLTILSLAALSHAAYTGPCSDQACGETSKVCPRGYMCVPWPSFDPALRKGCTCSYG
jgi:hypothetical protein